MDQNLYNDLLRIIFEKHPNRLERADFMTMHGMAKSDTVLAEFLLDLEAEGIIKSGSVNFNINNHAIFVSSAIILTAKGIQLRKQWKQA